MAVRCKECAFVAKNNEGYCPDCGAMYVEPLEMVDDSLAGRPAARPKAEKKKGGGLFSSLFGGGGKDEPVTPSRPAAAAAPAKQSELPTDVPRDQVKIRCRECQELAQLDAHEGFCPNCGAFYVEPHDYVTPGTLAAEREALQAEVDKHKKVVKSFDEMNAQEKLQHLQEQVEDTWDQLMKDRHVLNEKANECMQCFTAAGTLKSEDQFEVMASMITQRYKNLEDFEILYREYKKLLDAFNGVHDQLVAERKAMQEQQSLAKAEIVNPV